MPSKTSGKTIGETIPQQPGTSRRRVWMNGTFVDGDQATVPLLSHGFSRGSGIFETLGVRVGPDGPVAFRLDKHLERLQGSARLLGMELAYSSAEIFAAVAETVRVNQPGRGLVKIMAYWGEEAIVSLVPSARLDVAIFAIPTGGVIRLDDVTPISACMSTWRKLHPATVPVEAKVCANYLNGYLARKDAMDRGFDIGFLCDEGGRLAEGSTESVFLVQDGVLRTPRLGHILQSISRLTVLEIAAACGIEAEEADLVPQDLETAAEIFTSHSGVKVHPVGRYESRPLTAPGPISRQLITIVDDMMDFRDPRFGPYFQPLS
ncbi:MAG: aminotransferase class IV [bacterium]|nr:aminotransferase class IV [bacterium]